MRNRFTFAPESFDAYSDFDIGSEAFVTELADVWLGEVSRSSPEYVRWVQRSLNQILGTRLAVDGIIGSQTRSAIRSFQQRQGLTADGIVGPRTEQALIAAGVNSPPGNGTVPGSGTKSQTRATSCNKVNRLAVGKTTVWSLPGQTTFFFKAGMAIDADGAPNAYHQDSKKALDHLGNAGRPGNWWALVTDTGRPDGKPIVQGPSDPAPGFYVSATALADGTKKRTDPRRYVDSTKIPYVALPKVVMSSLGAKKGDFGVVINGENRKLSYAIFADVGPAGKLGEGSIALGNALGINPSPKSGGTSKLHVIYILFPGSGNQKPRPLAEINAEGDRLFKLWGGIRQIDACFTELGQEVDASGTDSRDRAIRLNHYYAGKLGWEAYFGRIVRLLGFTTHMPDETTFAQAVARWQQNNGLAVDGIVGPNTWAKMRTALGLVSSQRVNTPSS